MKKKNQPFMVAIPNLDRTAIAEVVKVSIPVCLDEHTNEWVLTEEAHQIIDDTKARYMGLILPAQMKELRNRLRFSQKQMGELFQTGEKSWARWESGHHRPTRSISLLIMALYEGKISLDYLMQKAGMKPAVAVIAGNYAITVQNLPYGKIIPFDSSYTRGFERRQSVELQEAY